MNSFCKQLFLSWQKPFNRINYRLINFDKKNKVLNMNEAYFKHLEEDKKIVISFRFVYDNGDSLNYKKIDRIFNFVRDINEKVEISMHRIKTNLEKELTKKTKKSKKRPENVESENSQESLQVGLRKFFVFSLLDFENLIFR